MGRREGAYLHTKWHLDPCSRLTAIDMGRKWDDSAPFMGRGWVPIEHKVPWAEDYLHTKWHLDASSRLAAVEMGRKLGRGLSPFLWRGAVSSSNTMWLAPRPTYVPSFILIRPTVWPQYTNVTGRTGQNRQRFDSIGRTVLQTVAQ